MVPQALLGAQVPDRVERIDRAGVRGAGRRGHQEGPQPRRAIGRDGRAQRIDAQAEVGIDRHAPHAVGQDAGQARGLGDAQVRLARGVEHALAQVLAQQLLARGHDRREVRQRATRREQPARAGGETHPLREPLEHVGLELHERGRGLPHTRVTVGGVGDEVGQGRGVQPPAGDEREITGSRGVEGVADPALEEWCEQRVEGHAVLGRTFAQRAAQLLHVGVAAGRLLLEAGQVLHDAREHLLAHRAQLLGRLLEADHAGDVRGCAGEAVGCAGGGSRSHAPAPISARARRGRPWPRLPSARACRGSSARPSARPSWPCRAPPRSTSRPASARSTRR